MPILNQATVYASRTTIAYPAPAGLLIDTYSGALVAYSFRKLSNSYAGSAVRIRRASDNAEADIGFSGNDFDSAAASAHIGGSSGFIVKWYDQSGNGYDVSNATAANQPSYIASGIGSKPCIDFVAGGNQLKTASLSTISAGASTKWTAFAVAYLGNTASSNARLLSLQGSADGDDFSNVTSFIALYKPGANEQVSAYCAGALAVSSIVYGTPNVLASILDSANHRIYIDAAASTPVAFSSSVGSALMGLSIGDTYTPAFVRWIGNVTEVIIWRSDQTSNLTSIDVDMGTYYGL